MDTIPSLLIAAQENPYDMTGLSRCSQIAAAVGELDADALLRKVDEAARELEGTASSPNRPSDQAAGQDARVGSVDS